MIIRRWAFLAGVLLLLAGVLVPFTVRVGAGILGLSQGNRYDTLYYTDFAFGLAVVAGALLIIVGIFIKPRRVRE